MTQNLPELLLAAGRMSLDKILNDGVDNFSVLAGLTPDERGVSKPLVSPMPCAVAVTSAECDEGIPPARNRRDQSQERVRLYSIANLKPCAPLHASNAPIKT